LLFPFIERAMLKKSLDVLPAKRFSGEKSSLLLALKVVSQTRYKEIFLASELGIKPRLVYACGSFQFLDARVRKPKGWIGIRGPCCAGATLPWWRRSLPLVLEPQSPYS
jgi:hypothetical protein